MKRLLTLIIVCLVGTSAMALQADINNDGRVDIADLAILAREWLMSEPALVVTGTLDPDVTGYYYANTEYNGRMSYKHYSLDFYVWWDDMGGVYLISPAQGNSSSGGVWLNFTPDSLLGEYIDVSQASGTATVSEYVPIEKPKPMRTRRSRMVIR